jgi:hypothetical protein
MFGIIKVLFLKKRFLNAIYEKFTEFFKCEKLTDGRTDDGRLPMTKAHMAYGQVS